MDLIGLRAQNLFYNIEINSAIFVFDENLLTLYRFTCLHAHTRVMHKQHMNVKALPMYLKLKSYRLNKCTSNQKKNLIISFVLGISITILCYFLNNCPYPYWDSLNKYSWLEYFLSNIVPEKNDRSDAFFINVSYARQVVDYTYSNGNLHGTIDITNRETLLKFLKIAEETNTYKYIFLDIRFEKGVESEFDSALFDQIKKMRNISYSSHSDLIDNDKAIPSKAAINDYFTTITSTNFTRYQYLQNGKESAPLKIFTAIDKTNNKTIKKWGPFFYSDWKLCQNSPFMRIPEDFWIGHEDNGHQNYYDLGPLLLTTYDVDDWEIEMKDKIVIVGNFVDDLHDTYAGLQPGSYLIYLAYKGLCNGKQFVSWGFICIMMIVYICISLFVLNRKTIWEFIPFFRNINNKFLLFIMNMLGFSTIFSLITIILYVFFNNTYNIFFPSLVFTIVNLFISYKYQA